MAATPLLVTPVTRAGALRSLVAANADGHTIANPNDRMWIEVANGGMSSINVTLTITKAVDGSTPAPKSVAVAAGATKAIGPFDTALYNDGDDLVTIGFSDVTSVTVGAFRI